MLGVSELFRLFSNALGCIDILYYRSRKTIRLYHNAYIRSIRHSVVKIYILFLYIDDDECMSSPSVCDANANCENTVGSYICSCKVGFSGEGKSCTGKSV